MMDFSCKTKKKNTKQEKRQKNTKNSGKEECKTRGF